MVKYLIKEVILAYGRFFIYAYTASGENATLQVCNNTEQCLRIFEKGQVILCNYRPEHDCHFYEDIRRVESVLDHPEFTHLYEGLMA